MRLYGGIGVGGMNINKLAMEFLASHVNANDIYMDIITKLPVKAVYSGPDCTGNLRTEPAVFWFDPESLS